MSSSNLNIPQKELAEFCKKHHIKKLSLFGSVLRDDFRADSDIDLIVEFEAGHTPGFFTIYDMENELSGLFAGRKIDLRTSDDLSRYFRNEVLSRSEVCYGT